MRHSIITRFTKFGILLCALSLGLAACEDEQQEPTGLEIEEREIERENGQIEEAEIEVEREQLDEIDRPADEGLVEELQGDEGADGEQAAGEMPRDQQMQQDQLARQQVGEQPQADQQQAGQQPASQQPQDLTAVFLAPVDFIGMPAEGTATVADVVSDRGFWLTDGQNRIFAVVREYDERIDINEGQRIQISGLVMAPGDASDIAGELEPQTKQIAEQQDILMTASWKDIKILDKAGEGAVGGGPGDQRPADKDKTNDSQNTEQ